MQIGIQLPELDTLAKRLKWARQQRDLSQVQLATRAGVKQSDISKIERGDTLKPTSLLALARALRVRADWLDTGDLPWEPDDASKEGYERVDGPLSRAPAYGMAPILAWEHPDDLPEGEFVMVPRLDVHLSAGGGSEQVEIDLVKDNPQAFRTEWIRLMRLKPGKLAAMRASGESMEPTIYDGDSLLVDTSQTEVTDGKVYALWYDGGERVKRLFRLPGGGMRIVSDNAKHPSIEMGPSHHEHVRIIGRVVHRSSIGGL